ncbi:oligosaccharide flippase family protein [Clostridium swellfunianum]|uniref:oligosaccharide flippase family protein n=1 Tax=Clostridium swellfunianum TaxID=1367462 RepID=UPI002030EBA1|nr:oligosaccharide flippase family protein [Clostridium swellfunianum]MCM0650576.1 oligosaccharide flippase family protein [Clostridium swellfunianum]
MNKSLFKNTIYKFLLSLFNLIIPVIIGPYTYRILGPDGMGMSNFSDSLFGYFLIFGAFGMYDYGLREVSRIRDNKEKLSNLFSSLFFFGMITNISVLIIYIVFITTRYSSSNIFPILLIYSFNLISNIFYVEWANEALENYNFITYKTIVVRIIHITLLLTFIKTSGDLYKYSFLLILYTFLNNIISFFYIKKSINIKLSKIKIRKHIKPLFMVVILANANILYTQLDRIILGEYVSKPSVAYYGMAQSIMYMIATVMLNIIFVTVPRLSNYLGNNDEASYINLLNKVTDIFFAFLFPASLGLFVLSNEVILLYGGKNFAATIPVLKVFSIYMISFGIEAILTKQIVYIKKKEKLLVYFILVCGVLNLISKIILLKLNLLTSSSAIITTCVSNSLLILIEYIYIKKSIKLDYNLLSLNRIKYIVASLLFIPITLLIRQYITGTISIFIFGFIINAAVYFLILLITKDKVLMFFINKILSKIKPK